MERSESKDSFSGTLFIDGLTTDGSLIRTIEISDGLIIDDYFQDVRNSDNNKEEDSLFECPEKFDIFCTPTNKSQSNTFGVSREHIIQRDFIIQINLKSFFR
jgi:hypothetical protein